MPNVVNGKWAFIKAYAPTIISKSAYIVAPPNPPVVSSKSAYIKQREILTANKAAYLAAQANLTNIQPVYIEGTSPIQDIGAVRLNGSNQQIKIPARIEYDSSTFTFYVYARQLRNSNGGDQLYFRLATKFGVYLNPSGNFIHYETYNGSWSSTTTSYVMPLNSWKLLCLTYDGTTFKMYVDGTQISSLVRTYTVYGTVSTNLDLYLGGIGTYYNMVDLAGATFLNYALSPTEVAALSKPNRISSKPSFIAANAVIQNISGSRMAMIAPPSTIVTKPSYIVAGGENTVHFDTQITINEDAATVHFDTGIRIDGNRNTYEQKQLGNITYPITQPRFVHISFANPLAPNTYDTSQSVFLNGGISAEAIQQAHVRSNFIVNRSIWAYINTNTRIKYENKNSYIEGTKFIYSSKLSYVVNIIVPAVNDATQAFINAEPPAALTDNNLAFIKAQDTASSTKRAFVVTGNPVSRSVWSYVTAPVLNNIMSSPQYGFIDGAYYSNISKDSFVFGTYRSIVNKNAYISVIQYAESIKGCWITYTNAYGAFKRTFIYGKQPFSSSKQAFLMGTLNIEQGKTAYIAGQALLEISKKAFLHTGPLGNTSSNSSAYIRNYAGSVLSYKNGYVYGENGALTVQKNAFIVGYPTVALSAYIMNLANKTSRIYLFINAAGRGSTTATKNCYLKA